MRRDRDEDDLEEGSGLLGSDERVSSSRLGRQERPYRDIYLGVFVVLLITAAFFAGSKISMDSMSNSTFKEEIINTGSSEEHDTLEFLRQQMNQLNGQFQSYVKAAKEKSKAASSTDGGPKYPTVEDCLEPTKQYIVQKADELVHQLPDNAKLRAIFKTGYTMNIVKTVRLLGDNTTFILTGDIPEMWLRDSAAQWHNFIPLSKQHMCTRVLTEGLIRRHAEYILHDSYANSYRQKPDYTETRLGRGGYTGTRNYEIDSGCYWMRMSYFYWKQTGSTAAFDEAFRIAAKKMVIQWKYEQNHGEGNSVYTYPELDQGGKGSPVSKTGMTWNAFRPSDDKCKYGYHIPGNLFVVASLQQIIEIFTDVYQDQISANIAKSLLSEIKAGIEKHGVTVDKGKRFYSYEVDGRGNTNNMDDANVPSLLSVPYLDKEVVFPYKSPSTHDQLYKETRSFILSKSNPFYYEGKYAKGIGSPHTPSGYIWHMALAMQGLTATTVKEKHEMLNMLLNTDANANQLHEGFDPNQPGRFTRHFFGWPNALFCEFVLQLQESGDLKSFQHVPVT